MPSLTRAGYVPPKGQRPEKKPEPPQKKKKRRKKRGQTDGAKKFHEKSSLSFKS